MKASLMISDDGYMAGLSCMIECDLSRYVQNMVVLFGRLQLQFEMGKMP